jgi:hypothetical protein
MKKRQGFNYSNKKQDCDVITITTVRYTPAGVANLRLWCKPLVEHSYVLSYSNTKEND